MIIYTVGISFSPILGTKHMYSLGGFKINSPGQQPSGVLHPGQRFISATSYQYTATCFRYCLQYLSWGPRPPAK